MIVVIMMDISIVVNVLFPLGTRMVRVRQLVAITLLLSRPRFGFDDQRLKANVNR